MTRNLIVLGCAGLLALGPSISSFAGLGDPDLDMDGIPDFADNCVIDSNGPLLGACSNQEDGLTIENPADPDGYGVSCDTDFNNNGATDPVDLGTMLAAVIGVSGDVHTDLNCNGAADVVDLGVTLLDTMVADLPGPSGKACQGMVPCP